jgi:hypothetical protein
MQRFTSSRLAVALVVAALTALNASAAEPDKLLPAKADSITYVNVKQLIESDAFKKFAHDPLKEVLARDEVKKVLEQMGLNPLKDIEKVWIGSYSTEEHESQAVTIIRGKFDSDKLLKAAEDAAKKNSDMFGVSREGNATLLKFQPNKGNPLFFTIVDSATVVVASDKKLAATALNQVDDVKAPIKAELADLVKTMDERASVFMVALVKGKVDNFQIPAGLSALVPLGDFEKAVPKTNTLTLAVNVGVDVNLEVGFGMKDSEAVGDMESGLGKAIEAFKGALPILVATNSKFQPLIDVAKTFKCSTQKKNVILSGKLSSENLGKLINTDE